jgi:hypothetical protein
LGPREAWRDDVGGARAAFRSRTARNLGVEGFPRERGQLFGATPHGGMEVKTGMAFARQAPRKSVFDVKARSANDGGAVASSGDAVKVVKARGGGFSRAPREEKIGSSSPGPGAYDVKRKPLITNRHPSAAFARPANPHALPKRPVTAGIPFLGQPQRFSSSTPAMSFPQSDDIPSFGGGSMAIGPGHYDRPILVQRPATSRLAQQLNRKWSP